MGAAVLLSTACTVHDIKPDPMPTLSASDGYSETVAPFKSSDDFYYGWWQSFKDPKLEGLILEAFYYNLDIEQALARLEQARADTKQSRAVRLPSVDLEASIRDSIEQGDQQEGSSRIGAALAWEMDVFGRLKAAEKADRLLERVRAEDVDAIRLMLSADIAEAYFRSVAQQQLLDLLARQSDFDKNLLELIELRFDRGIGTKVELLRQQSQLAATQSLIPPARADLRVSENRIDVLMGHMPDGNDRTKARDNLSLVKSVFPAGVPSDLLLNRPDLRALKYELVSQDAAIAEAIADRLPRITLDGDFLYADGPGAAGTTFSLLNSLVQPLLDWGERKAEVERNKALYRERLAAFTQAYQQAVEEVENLLYQEKQQHDFVERLKKRQALLRETVEQAESVYKQGLSDYLTVLDALQELNQIERDLISEKRDLALIRVGLHRAVGGQMTRIQKGADE